MQTLHGMFKTTGNESPQHQKAKKRLHQILEESPYFIVSDYEISLGTTKTALGQRDYTADLFGFWYNPRKGTHRKIAFEVRGFKGHNSKRNAARDQLRDCALAEKGIETVRLEMLDLVGKKKLGDILILNEILYQLNI